MQPKTEEKNDIKSRPIMQYYLQVPKKKVYSFQKIRKNELDDNYRANDKANDRANDMANNLVEIGDLSTIKNVSSFSQDSLSLSFLNKKENRKQVFHLKMKTFDDYIFMLHLLLDEKIYHYLNLWNIISK